MQTDLIWKSETARLGDLIDYEDNPRQITAKDFEKLKQSLSEDGYHQRILVDVNNTVIGGHARKRALLEIGYSEDSEVEIIRASRELTDLEFKRVNIRDNLQAGDWDFDMLANHFDAELLAQWGFDEKLFNFSADVDFPDLPEGEKTTLEQITFTLHPDQAATVYNALSHAMTLAGYDEGRSVNRNSSALLLILDGFLS